MMKRTLVALMLLALLIAPLGTKENHESEPLPFPKIKGVSDVVYQPENKEAETQETESNLLTAEPIHPEANDCAHSQGESSTDDYGGYSDYTVCDNATCEGEWNEDVSSGGFDIEGDGEFYDYGTVCGTCSGPWNAEANKCWHCNPE